MPPRNTTVQLSTPDTDLEPSNYLTPKFPTQYGWAASFTTSPTDGSVQVINERTRIDVTCSIGVPVFCPADRGTAVALNKCIGLSG